ncbi:MAG: DegT/DnrJ/EryC1/StrS family aminotransferase, partial [Nitrospiraceae bacterium]
AHRDPLRGYLRDQGVETLVHWPKPMWEHKGLRLGAPHLPETERVCREVLSLPMSAETTAEHVKITVEAVQRFFSRHV